MNGELQELYIQISSDLTALKARYEERWDNHDKRSDEIRGTINDIDKKLDSLPCGVHKERLSWLVWSTRLLWLIIIVAGLVKGALVYIHG